MARPQAHCCRNRHEDIRAPTPGARQHLGFPVDIARFGRECVARMRRARSTVRRATRGDGQVSQNRERRLPAGMPQWCRSGAAHIGVTDTRRRKVSARRILVYFPHLRPCVIRDGPGQRTRDVQAVPTLMACEVAARSDDSPSTSCTARRAESVWPPEKPQWTAPSARMASRETETCHALRAHESYRRCPRITDGPREPRRHRRPSSRRRPVLPEPWRLECHRQTGLGSRRGPGQVSGRAR